MNLEKVAVGGDEIVKMIQGETAVYPETVKDNLILWYDFKGKTNKDSNKKIARDLSGNGNHGKLINFSFDEGSGFTSEGFLEFDGVDDYIETELSSMGDDDSFTVVLTAVMNDSKRFIGQYNWHIQKSSLRTRGDDRFRLSFSGAEKGRATSLAFVYDGSKRTRVAKTFVNGGLVDEKSVKGSPIESYPGRSLVIGKTRHESGSYSSIDLYSVKFYDKALIESNINYIYKNEKERWKL